MTTALAIFCATFAAVFCLVLQSLNVNGGHRALAVITSFAIGSSHLVLYKVMPGPTDWLQIACYLLGGPVAVLVAMAFHPLIVAEMKRAKRKPTTKPDPDAWVAPPPGTAAVDVFTSSFSHWIARNSQAARSAPKQEPSPKAPTPRERMHTVNDSWMRRNERLTMLAQDLCDPEAYGHTVTPEIRNAARVARGLPPINNQTE